MQLIAPIRKAIRIRVQKGNLSRKKNSTKGEYKGKGHKDVQNLNDTIVKNMGIMNMTVQDYVIMLILLKKISETRNSRICWI